MRMRLGAREFSGLDRLPVHRVRLRLTVKRFRTGVCGELIVAESIYGPGRGTCRTEYDSRLSAVSDLSARTLRPLCDFEPVV